jgi:DASH complex subunit DAD2
VANMFALAVALVLSNWHNVLRAISMASGKKHSHCQRNRELTDAAKIPKPKDVDEDEQRDQEPPLPQTLVRIPTKDAPSIPQPTTHGSASGGE